MLYALSKHSEIDEAGKGMFTFPRKKKILKCGGKRQETPDGQLIFLHQVASVHSIKHHDNNNNNNSWVANWLLRIIFWPKKQTLIF